MTVKQLTAGVKKELWEFHTILFWLPIVIAAVVVILPALQYLAMEDYQWQNLVAHLAHFPEHTNFSELGQLLFVAMSGLFLPFLIISAIVQLYYFTACLFDERRDLSVYFWRSLPVSDALTVAVKFITGALIVPIIFLLAATAALLIYLVVALIVSIVLSVGYDVSVWQLWVNAELVTNLASLWFNLLPYTLWMLPIYAWLMLASIFAKKAPFLWAVIPVVIVLIAEVFIVQFFNLSSYFFLEMVANYFAISPDMIEHYWQQTSSPRLMPLQVLTSKIDWLALLLTAGLLYLTYWLRANRSHG